MSLNNSVDTDRLRDSLRAKSSRPNTAAYAARSRVKKRQPVHSSRATTANTSVDITFNDISMASTFQSSNYIVESQIRHENSPKKPRKVTAREGLKRVMERLREEFLD